MNLNFLRVSACSAVKICLPQSCPASLIEADKRFETASLRYLCVLGVSAVKIRRTFFNRRDAENAEVAQRVSTKTQRKRREKRKLGHHLKSLNTVLLIETSHSHRGFSPVYLRPWKFSAAGAASTCACGGKSSDSIETFHSHRGFSPVYLRPCKFIAADAASTKSSAPAALNPMTPFTPG
jgi:hypothetical protein